MRRGKIWIDKWLKEKRDEFVAVLVIDGLFGSASPDAFSHVNTDIKKWTRFDEELRPKYVGVLSLRQAIVMGNPPTDRVSIPGLSPDRRAIPGRNYTPEDQ